MSGEVLGSLESLSSKRKLVVLICSKPMTLWIRWSMKLSVSLVERNRQGERTLLLFTCFTSTLSGKRGASPHCKGGRRQARSPSLFTLLLCNEAWKLAISMTSGASFKCSICQGDTPYSSRAPGRHIDDRSSRCAAPTRSEPLEDLHLNELHAKA